MIEGWLMLEKLSHYVLPVFWFLLIGWLIVQVLKGPKKPL